jgi:hypothetical protein
MPLAKYYESSKKIRTMNKFTQGMCSKQTPFAIEKYEEKEK